MIKKIENQLSFLREINSLPYPGLSPKKGRKEGKLKKVLISNRGEIAKRFFLALHERKIPSVAVVSDVDINQSWYEMTDEVIYIGNYTNYANIDIIIAAALLSGANAIYPGYGFLSENPNFPQRIQEVSGKYKQNIIFMGPFAEVMNKVGNKLEARELARKNHVPFFSGSEKLFDYIQAEKAAKEIGYPVIIKLNKGGGGKGMAPVFKPEGLKHAVHSCQRIGANLYKDESFYIEKFILKPVHIEVQIFNGEAIGLRKCAVQRNSQKIIEETGEFFLSDDLIVKLYQAAEVIALASGYHQNCGAGTVEFLLDTESNEIGFLEVNTRLQVEHPVTDESLGIDLAAWQILNFDGKHQEIPYIRARENRQNTSGRGGINHTIECRIYAENPAKGYAPSPGMITELKLPAFQGIRCDFGFGIGDRILPYYDPMIGKVIVYAKDREECIVKLERALSELYVGGIHHNIEQLLNVISHPSFLAGDYTNCLLSDHEELKSIPMDDKVASQIAVFSALCSRIHKIRQHSIKSIEMMSLDDSMWLNRFADMSETCHVEIKGREYEIDIIQNAINLYHVFLHKHYMGNFQIFFGPEQRNRFLIKFGIELYKIETDHSSKFMAIKVKTPQNKIYYSRVEIRTNQNASSDEPVGLKKSPFQSAFVRLMPEKESGELLKTGSKVHKNDPIIIISAMKMETTIHAHMDGVITYLLEDGDISKLELDRTDDGMIIGRSIKEDEPLFLIENLEALKEVSQNRTKKSKLVKSIFTDPSAETNHFLMNILKKDQKILLESKDDLTSCLDILFSYLKGLYSNKEITQKLIDSLESLPDQKFQGLSQNLLNDTSIEDSIREMISFYVHIKKVFSQAIFKNKFSYFDELTLFYKSLKDTSDYHFSIIKPILDNLFQSYVEDSLKIQFLENNFLLKVIFLFLPKAFYHSLESETIIKAILKILNRFSQLSPDTRQALKLLLLEEEKEKDDSLAKYIRQTFPVTIRTIQIEDVMRNPRDSGDYTEFIQKPFAILGKEKASEIKKRIMDSAKSFLALDDQSSRMPSWAKKEFKRKMNMLEKTYQIKPCFSPLETCYVFELTSKNNIHDQRYFIISIAHQKGKSSRGAKGADPLLSIKEACVNLAKCVHLYQKIKPNQNNKGEVYAFQYSYEVDILKSAPNRISYKDLVSIAEKLWIYFTNINVNGLILYTRFEPLEKKGKNGLNGLFFVRRDRKLHIDIVDEEYEEYIYQSQLLPAKQKRQYDLDKWPIEKWINQTFDGNEFQELSFDSIDNFVWTNPKTNAQEIKPVGSKIFIGNIHDHPACFYMKDSRIAGGATGNLEGLKYIAACYVSILLKVPLYVWNDGAGANIKEGMISLKRAAQGFMMNTIIGAKLDEKRFLQFITDSSDPILKDLLEKVRTSIQSNRVKKYLSNSSQASFVVAVGIGSSTGLDVYGSSQAAIQVMLDSESSYRVLTGANVIESVTGEKMTNYEIGGAKIMTEWTGIVNLIAYNKFEIIKYIRLIQAIFLEKQFFKNIQRKTKPAILKASDFEVINEGIIQENVDHGSFLPFNEKFFKGGSLFAGFAKIGGYPLFIMGPRTDLGIRSYISIVKARELVRVSQKLATRQIYVWGEYTYERALNDDGNILRARIELLKTINKPKKNTRICIFTNGKGIHDVLSHLGADVLIYIQEAKIQQNLQNIIDQNVNFIVESYPAAFDLCLRLFHYLDAKPDADDFYKKQAKNKPKLPKELSKPYNIIDNVIEQVFDEGSFIEFNKSMGALSKGLSLISGLAKIDGKTVGILADQPDILGGAADAIGTEKFRIFTEFLDKNKIPLVMLSNSPGFLPGTKQERLRIQQIGGESLDVNILSTIPVVSVVLKQTYGGRQIHAFSRDLRPHIVYITFDNSVMAVMGADASFDLFYKNKYVELIQKGNKKEANEMKKQYIKDFNEKAAAKNDAMESGMIDFIIPSVEKLREHIVTGLQKAHPLIS